MKEFLHRKTSGIFDSFSELEQGEILRRFGVKSVSKNSILLNAGEECKHIYMVRKGCLRSYFTTKDGREKTRSLWLENDLGTAFTSFISQSPSLESISAVDDTEFYYIHHSDFFHLVDTDPLWLRFYKSILEYSYLLQSRKVEALMTLTAKQRFQKLQNGNPKLIQRLSNKILASFLDMREETLSRAKGK